MHPNDHTELLHVELRFPRRGQNGIPATIWLHVSVVCFFKGLPEKQIQELQQYLVLNGERYFGSGARSWCRFQSSKEYGLQGWDCPGNATGFNIASGQSQYAQDETRKWIEYHPHNVDRADQFAYLLAAACYFRDIAEASFRAK